MLDVILWLWLSCSLFALLVIVSRYFVRHEIHLRNEEVGMVKSLYQDEFFRKQDLDRERKVLEDEAAEIFALYDITKEMTKTFYESDALMAFRNKLKEYMYFEDCLLLDPLSDDIQKLNKDPAYFLFILRGKTRLLGYLAIKGVRAQDREKATILAHQFALALQRIRLYQELHRLAMTDSLTELLTRRSIMERFEEELRRARSRQICLSFLMVDVDHFKRFNDQHGHLSGDQILRGIAGVIRENVREIDIVGRYGGEEFCVVLPDTDREGASYVAERIRTAVENTPVKAYDLIAKATVSIGLATFPKDGQQSCEILEKSDWALYRAKKRGRNCICIFGMY